MTASSSHHVDEPSWAPVPRLHANRSGTARRARRYRRVGQALLGRAVMGVWILMPLMPALAALLSWLGVMR